MLCIVILKRMGFLNYKSWLGLNEYNENIRLYERRPWVFLIPAAQDIACLEVLRASERTSPLLLWESKHQTAKISILFPPELQLSQCGDAELMVQAGHREGSWCRTCSSLTSRYQSATSVARSPSCLHLLKVFELFRFGGRCGGVLFVCVVFLLFVLWFFY